MGTTASKSPMASAALTKREGFYKDATAQDKVNNIA